MRDGADGVVAVVVVGVGISSLHDVVLHETRHPQSDCDGGKTNGNNARIPRAPPEAKTQLQKENNVRRGRGQKNPAHHRDDHFISPSLLEGHNTALRRSTVNGGIVVHRRCRVLLLLRTAGAL